MKDINFSSYSGQSLLSLINIELEKELRTLRHFQSNDLFAKTILSQVNS